MNSEPPSAPSATAIEPVGDATPDWNYARVPEPPPYPNGFPPTDSGSHRLVVVPAGYLGLGFGPAHYETSFGPILDHITSARVLARMCMRALLSRARARASLGRAPRA